MRRAASGAGSACAAGMANVDAQRPALGGQLLGIHHLQAMRRERGRDGAEREVLEVLVVDDVELCLPHQAQQVVELEGELAVAANNSARPARKSFRSGTCATTLLATSRRGRSSFLHQIAGGWHARRTAGPSARLSLPPPRPRWRQAPRPARRALPIESTAAGIRRCWQPPPPGPRGAARAAAPCAAQSVRSVSGACRRTTRSSCSERRWLPPAPPPAAAPARSGRRGAAAAGSGFRDRAAALA